MADDGGYAMSAIEETGQARLQASLAGVQSFLSMGLGLSVHWGLYSILGRNEWAMDVEHISMPAYEGLVSRFNPTRFDADAWADLMAEIGAKAFIITSKHHDGFCLFDSALTDYTAVHSPFGRDPLSELVQACRKRGSAVYFYYSLLDWHHPAYLNDWPAYVAYYQGQLRELCSNYGPLGGILFDGYWPHFDYTRERGHFRAGGSWDLAGTYDLIHELQPQAMVTNNHHVLPLKGEDYQVWELDLPGENSIGFNTTEIGELPRATWFNVNTGWSFRYQERAVKSPQTLAAYVTKSASRLAACWLNVGPTPEGEILAEDAEALRGMARILRAT
jgi:alpha-L-fucosidase